MASADQDQAREREFAVVMAARTRPAIVAFAALVVLVAVGTSHAVRHPTLSAAVCAGATLLSIVRIRLVRRMSEVASVERYRAAFAGLTVFAAAYWSVFAFLALATSSSARDQLVILMPTAGLAAGATMSLAPSTRLVRAYLTLVLAPVALFFGMEGHRQGIACMVATILYFVFLVSQARRLRGERIASVDGAEALRARASLAAGCNNHVTKPIRCATLLAAVVRNTAPSPAVEPRGARAS